jgi:SAM-dependent methyltransferase
MSQKSSTQKVDVETLRREIRKEYAEVASSPEKGFHFHTGRTLAKRLEYPAAWVDALPVGAVESFAGTGNPFTLGELRPVERVVDVGCGAGFDSLIAARLVGPTGHVVGVDMTPEMLKKARGAAAEAGLTQAEFREGHAESLPVPDGWADVVISNGVVNLCPDKAAVFREMFRVLKPGGRIQIGDILVQKAVPESAKEDISLWTG